MSRHFTRREKRAIGSFSRQMHKFWTRVREDIGDERVDAWYNSGDIEHLGHSHARELIEKMNSVSNKMERARRWVRT